MTDRPREPRVEYLSCTDAAEVRSGAARAAGWNRGRVAGALGLVARLALSLGEVRALLGRADATWPLVAVGLEGRVQPVRRRAVPPGRLPTADVAAERRRSRSPSSRVGSIVPAGGPGGVALGALIVSRLGMSGALIARRSVAFLLIKSSVNFVAVALIGVVMFLTALPAGIAAAAVPSSSSPA